MYSHTITITISDVLFFRRSKVGGRVFRLLERKCGTVYPVMSRLPRHSLQKQTKNLLISPLL